MVLSLVCAIQCALTPILLSIAPIIPKWAHFGHGWIWIGLIVVIAVWSIGRGYQKHNNRKVVFLTTLGTTFLIIGTVLEQHLTIFYESLIFVSGGLMLTYAHWKNYQLEKVVP